MVCPKCFSEFFEGVKVCIDCRILLVDELAADPLFGNGSDKLVHFMTCFSKHEAESGRSLLESHQIKAIVSMDEVRGVRLWIHNNDARKAIQVFQERTAEEKRSGNHSD